MREQFDCSHDRSHSTNFPRFSKFGDIPLLKKHLETKKDLPNLQLKRKPARQGNKILRAVVKTYLHNSPNIIVQLYDDKSLVISGTGPMTGYSSISEVPWNDKLPYAYTSTVIHEGITSIGSYTFCNSMLRGRITLPSTITAIGEAAFSQIRDLYSINLPDGIKTIGNRAFESTSLIPPPPLPSELEYLGDYAFSDIQMSEKLLIIPKKVTYFGTNAFDGGFNEIKYCGSSEMTTDGVPYYSGSIKVPDGYKYSTFCRKPLLKVLNQQCEIKIPSNSFSNARKGASKKFVVSLSVVSLVALYTTDLK